MINTTEEAMPLVMGKLGYSSVYADGIDSKAVRIGWHFWRKGDEKLSDEEALQHCLSLDVLAGVIVKKWPDGELLIGEGRVRVYPYGLNQLYKFAVSRNLQDAALIATGRALDPSLE